MKYLPSFGRKTWIYIHLAIASLFMPLMLMMPLTGSLYLLGFKGDQTKSDLFVITEKPPEPVINDSGEEDLSAQEEFFRQQFSKNGIDARFEYIRPTKTEYIFRPTTRTHYVATKKDDGTMSVARVEPGFLKSTIELHKGHGPRFMRWFEVLFGLALILTTLSGVWLAWTVQPYRKVMTISVAAGVLAMVAALI